MTGAAGQFGPAGHDHAILRRNDVEPLALIAPISKRTPLQHGQQVSARHQGFDDARQMLRQLATVGSALGCSLLAHFGTSAILGCFESRDGLIDVLQNKL